LPADVSVNSSTGLISGTPTAVDSGTVTVTCTDQYGRTVQDTFTFTNTLRTQNEEGAFYDFSNLANLRQNSDGTGAVSLYGDPVGFVLDQSKGATSFTAFPEEIINNDFSAGTTGFASPRANSSLSVISGNLRSTAIATGAYGLRQTLTGLTVGQRYRVEWDLITDGGPSTFFLRVNATPELNGANELVLFATTNGIYAGTFLATASTLHVGVINVATSIGDYIELSGITLRELPGNHLTQSTSTARPLLARVPVGGRRNLAALLKRGLWKLRLDRKIPQSFFARLAIWD
jgi:hypothetical protein